jgi:hypothetical protein
MLVHIREDISDILNVKNLESNEDIKLIETADSKSQDK